tara:strand:+ start:4108 stop:5193 length:1086 start_codon:yes stop_codon:yes gene_type:complete
MHWMLRKSAPPMRLGALAAAANAEDREDGKGIDFGAAGLYLPGAQTIVATTTSACVSVLACWLVPLGAISAVRTLALTATAGILIIRKPIKIGNTKGVNTIFAALRPCCLLYVSCLVLEQLVHTCVSDEASYEHGFWRRLIYHVAMTVMTVSGFMRARSPRAEQDLPFLLSTGSLLAVALLPPPALALSGPLCSPPTLLAAGERVLRSFLFAVVYVVLVYASAPISNNLADTLVCIARSATASAWVLGALVFSLPLAFVQVCLVLYCSFAPSNTQYDSVQVDVESAPKPGLLAAPSPRAPSPAMSAASAHDDEATAIATARLGRPVSFQPIAGGLSFSLPLSQNGHTQLSDARIAEIAASM